MQLGLEQRFQEPISIADYAAGTRQSALVDVSNIDSIPVTLLHGRKDSVCPVKYIETYFNAVKSKEKFIIIDEEYGHGEYFTGLSSAGMIQVIKTGTRDPESVEGAVQFGLIGLFLSAAILF